MKIAILGCGQLARMMAQAAARLGVDCAFVALEGESTACVDGFGKIVHWSSHGDARALYNELGQPSLVTVEREMIDVGLLRELQSLCQVAPSPECVLVGQNRARERTLLQELDIPCAPYRIAHNRKEVRAAVAELGLPLVVKACEAGYDGKLQWRFRTEADVEHFCRQEHSGEWIIEHWVPFEREVSIVAARSTSGEFVAYPLSENVHREGILLASIAPARDLSQRLQRLGTQYIQTIMSHLHYVGVMAVEFFVVDDALWVNELAPRVHNSGHWTMLEDITSQFENHVRAILGMPLGNTTLHRHAGMLNILGSTDGLGTVQPANPKVQLHLYNKAPAPQRKLGHVNITAASNNELLVGLDGLHERVYGQGAECQGLFGQALADSA